MKVCYIDVETTGLDAVKNDIIQLAGIIEIDGEVKATFEFECQPYSFENLEPKAMEVNGYTRQDLEKFDVPIKVKTQLECLFSKYVDKFNKNDKFIFAGYNSPFDFRFMKEWWKKGGDKYWGSYFEYKQMDIYPLFQMYAIAAKLDLPNHKLVTAAAHFGLDFGEEGAHDAMADIRVTREVGLEIQAIFDVGIRVSKLGTHTKEEVMKALQVAEAAQ